MRWHVERLLADVPSAGDIQHLKLGELATQTVTSDDQLNCQCAAGIRV